MNTSELFYIACVSPYSNRYCKIHDIYNIIHAFSKCGSILSMGEGGGVIKKHFWECPKTAPNMGEGN